MKEAEEEPAEELRAAAAYVLQGSHACYQCQALTPVYAILLVGPFRGKVEELVEANDVLLVGPTDLPEKLSEVVTSLSGGSCHPDFSHTAGEEYWMNHCQECGAKIGAWDVKEPGAAFFPMTDAEIASLVGTYVEGPFELVDQPLSFSSWTEEWVRRQSR